MCWINVILFFLNIFFSLFVRCRPHIATQLIIIRRELWIYLVLALHAVYNIIQTFTTLLAQPFKCIYVIRIQWVSREKKPTRAHKFLFECAVLCQIGEGMKKKKAILAVSEWVSAYGNDKFEELLWEVEETRYKMKERKTIQKQTRYIYKILTHNSFSSVLYCILRFAPNAHRILTLNENGCESEK